MKIGDKVRFLNEIGGGKIVAFKKNNIVLVEDEDGFEIPMQLNDIAIVQSDDYSTAKVIGATIQIREKQQKNWIIVLSNQCCRSTKMKRYLMILLLIMILQIER